MDPDELSDRNEEYREELRLFFENRDQTHITNAFRLLDLNGDGLVSKYEALQVLSQNLPIEDANEKLESMFARADANHDGFLDLEEYVSLALLILKEKDGRD